MAAFTAALNSALTLAAAALEVQLQQPAAATGGADSVGARLLVLPDASEELLASVNPPFNNTCECVFLCACVCVCVCVCVCNCV